MATTLFNTGPAMSGVNPNLLIGGGPAPQGGYGGGLFSSSSPPLTAPTGFSPGSTRISPSNLPPGQNASQSGYGTGIVPGMLGVYNQLLGLNQQNYQNVLNAYNQGQTNLATNLPSISQGYGNVLSGINNTLGMGQVLGQNGNWGIAQPAATAIGKAYTQNLGNTAQGLINSGLGNSTVLGNLQGQNTYNAANAYAGLGAQLAQTAAGYQANIGLGQLAQEQAGLGLQTNLTEAGLGHLGAPFSNTAGSLTGGFGQSAFAGTQYPYGNRGGTVGRMGNDDLSGGSQPSRPNIQGNPYYGSPGTNPNPDPSPVPIAPGTTQGDWNAFGGGANSDFSGFYGGANNWDMGVNSYGITGDTGGLSSDYSGFSNVGSDIASFNDLYGGVSDLGGF